MNQSNIPELETPPGYFELSQDERKNLFNQCGPDGPINKMIPDRLLGTSIARSCNRHDLGFILAKDQKDHKSADDAFLRNMDREIDADSQNAVSRVLKKGIARVYYMAVRLYSLFFGKRKK